MFLDELRPIAKKILENPLAFAGGFASGLLRLNLNDDPVKSWLSKQSNGNFTPPPAPDGAKPPQSIDIE
jgi:hypothetical protein